jgi:hypothetical protein
MKFKALNHIVRLWVSRACAAFSALERRILELTPLVILWSEIGPKIHWMIVLTAEFRIGSWILQSFRSLFRTYLRLCNPNLAGSILLWQLNADYTLAVPRTTIFRILGRFDPG